MPVNQQISDGIRIAASNLTTIYFDHNFSDSENEIPPTSQQRIGVNPQAMREYGAEKIVAVYRTFLKLLLNEPEQQA